MVYKQTDWDIYVGSIIIGTSLIVIITHIRRVLNDCAATSPGQGKNREIFFSFCTSMRICGLKKKEKDGTITYEADSDLRDTENVPLDQNIQDYFKREVLQHIPDAWIDKTKTVKGYEISFTRYFYNYVPPRSIEEITKEIFALEKETDGILNEIVNN